MALVQMATFYSSLVRNSRKGKVIVIRSDEYFPEAEEKERGLTKNNSNNNNKTWENFVGMIKMLYISHFQTFLSHGTHKPITEILWHT